MIWKECKSLIVSDVTIQRIGCSRVHNSNLN